MLKYLRDKLFFDLGPTATTDLSRDICRVSGITSGVYYRDGRRQYFLSTDVDRRMKKKKST